MRYLPLSRESLWQRRNSSLWMLKTGNLGNTNPLPRRDYDAAFWLFSLSHSSHFHYSHCHCSQDNMTDIVLSSLFIPRYLLKHALSSLARALACLWEYAHSLVKRCSHIVVVTCTCTLLSGRRRSQLCLHSHLTTISLCHCFPSLSFQFLWHGEQYEQVDAH